MIDETYVAARVRHLRAQGFPATEGYYLVVLSPTESRELKRGLTGKRTKRWYKHPPHALTTSARLQGHEVTCVLGDALVVSADHTQVLRCSQQPEAR